MGPEASLERSVVAWCSRHGHRCLKLRGSRGWPDRTVFLSGGGIVFLELKSRRGRLSAHQQREIAWLRREGYHVAVCRTLDEVKKAIEG
jgi:hypothetical protein